MTELHDITVHYERLEGGIATETHTASRERWWHEESNTTLCVDTGLCACCDAVEETHEYNHDRVVKVEYEPSNHEREERDDILPVWYIPLLWFLCLVAFTVTFLWLASGGTVSL